MSKEPKDEIIKGHEYDGIQELDNPLPKWWLFIFYATIVYGIGYAGYYEFLGGPTLKQELDMNMAALAEKKQSQQPKVSISAENVDIEALLADTKAMETGKAGYLQSCAACHGQNGEGGIGPNLTDNYWIHSKGELAGVVKALREGFPDKGMPPWAQIVPAEQHIPISAYIVSLRGSKPENAKEPQGELIE